MSDEVAWRKVASSLKLLFIVLLVKIALTLALGAYAATVFTSVETIEALDTTLNVMAWVLGVVFVVELVCLYALFGYAKVPEASGARGTALATVIIAGAVLAMDVMAALPIFEHDYDALDNSVWDTLSSLGTVAQFFTLLASFRTLSTHLGQADLAKMAGRAIALAGILIGVLIFGFIIGGVARSEVVLILVGLVGVVLGVWAFVLQLIVIYQLSRRARAESEVATAFI